MGLPHRAQSTTPARTNFAHFSRSFWCAQPYPRAEVVGFISVQSFPEGDIPDGSGQESIATYRSPPGGHRSQWLAWFVGGALLGTQPSLCVPAAFRAGPRTSCLTR